MFSGLVLAALLGASDPRCEDLAWMIRDTYGREIDGDLDEMCYSHDAGHNKNGLGDLCKEYNDKCAILQTGNL